VNQHDPEPRFVRLGDGRRLAYAEYGDPHGTPSLYFHGTPGSRLEAGMLDDAARREGVRLIGIDRPGYGYSDRDPKHTLTCSLTCPPPVPARSSYWTLKATYMPWE